MGLGEKKVRVANIKPGVYAHLRGLPPHGILLPHRSCPRLVLSTFVFYILVECLSKEETENKYRGLAPHKITPMSGVLHAKPDLRVFLKWKIAGSGSVIADVIPLSFCFAATTIEKYAFHRIQ